MEKEEHLATEAKRRRADKLRRQRRFKHIESKVKENAEEED